MKCELDALGVFVRLPLNGSHGICLRADEIRAERTGIHSRVSVWYEDVRMAYDTFNVSRNEERARISKEAWAGLGEKAQAHYPREALKHDLDNFLASVWDVWQERDPAREIVITGDEEPVPPKWLLEPLILENQANIIYGERSSTKSLTALILAATGLLQWQENPLRLKPSPEYWETLYLDFERNDQIATYNLARLQRGMKLAPLMIHYKRLSGMLSRNAEWVRKYLRAHSKIRLTIVDSITPAAGGDLNQSEGAQQMYDAERSWNATTLFLAHASAKDPLKKRTSVIGHSAYETYAGNIWECRKQQEEQSLTADTCLYHTKAPAVCGLRRPISYRTVFDEEHHFLKVSFLNPETVSEFVDRMNLKTRILNMLLHGEMSSRAISDSLSNENPNTVRSTLLRLRAKGAIVETRKEGKISYWGLLSRNS